MADILALNPEERIRLIGQIWDSITEIPDAVQLTEEQRRELEARLATHREDSRAGSLWADVKARILSR